MLEENEMDGGRTLIDGVAHQIILDDKGVFKRTVELSAKAAKAVKTSMDVATDRAAAATEPPGASVPGTVPEGDRNQGGYGFRAPT